MGKQHEQDDIKETIKLERALSVEGGLKTKPLDSTSKEKAVVPLNHEVISRGTTEGCLPLPGEQQQQQQQQQQTSTTSATLPLLRESWPSTTSAAATRAEKENNKAAVHMLRSLGTMQDSTQQEEDFAFDTITSTGAPVDAAAAGPYNPPPLPPTTLEDENKTDINRQTNTTIISGKEQALLDIQAFEERHRGQRASQEVLLVGKKTAVQRHSFPENIVRDIAPIPSSAVAQPALQSTASLPGAHPVHGIGGSNAAPVEEEGSLEFGVSSRSLQQQNEQQQEEAEQLQPVRMLSGAAIHASLALTEVDEEQQDEEVAALGTEHLEEVLDVVAMPSDPEKNTEPKWQLTKSKRFNLGCLLLIVGIFFAILFGFILKPNDDDGGSVSTTTTNPSGGGGGTINYHVPFDDNLLAFTKDLIAEDVTSPQYKANAWMLNDPNLNSYPLWRKMQRFGMATKYYSLQGDDWYHNDHWLSYEISECYWWSRNTTTTQMPRCNELGQLVVEDLSSNNLNGTIPPETQINTLIYVNNSNNLIGGQPPPMTGHGVMEVFDLSNNQLEGPMVAYGGFDVPVLRVLKFEGNRLEGRALMGFLVLANLEIFDATANRFDGSLPTQVGQTSNLTHLLIGDNQFTGTLPSQIGLLKKLQQLNISGNVGMSGTIPTELALATSLQKLDLSRTSVGGIIPPELCLRNVSIIADCRQIRCC